MIIKSIKIKGFKGFKDEYFLELDEEETTIMGENFQGKTSIGEAICWCLLGCNFPSWDPGIRGRCTGHA